MAGESLRDSNPQEASRSTPCTGNRLDGVALLQRGQQAIEPLLPPPEWVVGLTVLPVLAGMVGARLTGQSLAELGELAEEIFRGDRLPILSLPRGTAAQRPD